jgi:Ni/Fe-hydrogenase subunit HybB-like protein
MGPVGMAYIAVLWIEFSPAFLERFGFSRLRQFLERFMFVIIALGVLLPTMHQSALGTILAVNETKLSPLWWTQLLPVLYLLSAIAMGYSIVAFEATLVSRGFRLKSELPLLSSIARITLWLIVAFLVIRIGVIVVNGNLGLAVEPTHNALLFWVETVLFGAAVVLLSTDRLRRTERYIFLSACALLNSYLMVYKGTPGWRYFPSVPELMITIGLVSLHVLLFILFCRLLPVLSNPPREVAEGHAS